MKKLFLTLFASMLFLAASAQKSVYIPQQTLKDEGYDPSTTVNNLNVPWCRYRSRESDNIIVFWAAGYGNNDPNSTAVPPEYRVDIDDMLAKLESFYDLNVNRLKFADLSHSNLSRYKMIICLYYTTEWMAYGGGFDDVIGGMWVSPSTCHPVGSTIAHEIGHSFQYQVNCDLKGAAGFRYNFGDKGCGYWEATANWQAAMAYPDEMYSTSMFIYRQAYNMAYTHEWMRYQSYWMNYWWVDRHGLDMVGRIWRGGTQWGDDVNQVYMKIMNMNVNDLYKEYMDAAMHFVTWDFNNDDWKRRGSYFDIGNFVYNYVPVGNGEFQVAYSSCPQSTGYNVIPLEVPASGTTVTTHFTALPPGAPLAEGDPKMFWNGAAMAPINVNNYNHFAGGNFRGFRLGYVALLKDGRRVYQTEDKVYCTGTQETSVDVSFTVPTNVDRMWLVVSPALSHYIMHNWNEIMEDDDQWPYRVKFTNTSIPGSSKYYMYDTASQRFLSRGGNGGVQAVADEFGLPVLFSTATGGQYLQMLDNTASYIAASGTAVTTAGAQTLFIAEETDGQTLYRNTRGQYLSVNAATGAIELTTDKSKAAKWQIMTSGQRNNILKDKQNETDKQLAAKANISVGKMSLAQHAENDFTPVDMTSKVNNASLSQNTVGWTLKGSGATADAGALEVYQGTGTELSQTVGNLPKGLYKVSLSGFYRDGWPANCVNMAGSGFAGVSNAYIEANGMKAMIADWASGHSGDQYPNFRNEAKTCFNEGRYHNEVFTFVDRDGGSIDLKIVSPQHIEGGWFCFSDLKLTYYGMNDELVPEYTDIISDTPDTPDMTLPTGKVYLRNRASGLFLNAGNSLGTQASLSTDALDFLAMYKQNGQYTLNSRYSNGTGQTYLGKPSNVGGPLYLDAATFNWGVTATGDGYYLLSYLATSEEGATKRFYLGYSEGSPSVVSTRLTDATDPAAQWEALTRDELVAYLHSESEKATPARPVDVTSFITAANFNRNDQRITSAWKGTPTIGGDDNNRCAEVFGRKFEVYQIISDLLPGKYRITLQGFHRNGAIDPSYEAFRNNSETNVPIIYANDKSTKVVSIYTDGTTRNFPAGLAGRWATPAAAYNIPDDMVAASTAFTAGFYKNSLDFEVGENGTLRIGLKNESANPEFAWTCFDNFRLFCLETSGESNAITDVRTDARVTDKAVYDLQGRKVAASLSEKTLPAGIYIVGGKKMLISQ